MKTTILTVAAATLLLASCSSEDPISVNNGRAIDFRPAMSSRATETTNANLSELNATAFLGDGAYFSNVTFSKNGSFYTSANDYYWPGDDSQLTFYAYSPITLDGVTLSNTTKTVADYSPADNISRQLDIVTAKATGKKSENESAGVPLTFNHALSQIQINGKTENEVYSFKVSGVRIGNPVSTGTFDFDNGWTIGTSKAVYESTYDNAITLGSTATTLMGENGNAMLIPQQLVAWNPADGADETNLGAYLSVRLQINIKNDDGTDGVQIYPFPSNADCIWAAIPIDTNWEPGKKYVYTLDFTHGAGYVDPKDPIPGTPILGGPIKFTVDVTDWVEVDEELDMTTYTPAQE